MSGNTENIVDLSSFVEVDSDSNSVEVGFDRAANNLLCSIPDWNYQYRSFVFTWDFSYHWCASLLIKKCFIVVIGETCLVGMLVKNCAFIDVIMQREFLLCCICTSRLIFHYKVFLSCCFNRYVDSTKVSCLNLRGVPCTLYWM